MTHGGDLHGAGADGTEAGMADGMIRGATVDGAMVQITSTTMISLVRAVAESILHV